MLEHGKFIQEREEISDFVTDNSLNFLVSQNCVSSDHFSAQEKIADYGSNRKISQKKALTYSNSETKLQGHIVAHGVLSQNEHDAVFEAMRDLYNLMSDTLQVSHVSLKQRLPNAGSSLGHIDQSLIVRGMSYFHNTSGMVIPNHYEEGFNPKDFRNISDPTAHANKLGWKTYESPNGSSILFKGGKANFPLLHWGPKRESPGYFYSAVGQTK